MESHGAHADRLGCSPRLKVHKASHTCRAPLAPEANMRAGAGIGMDVLSSGDRLPCIVRVQHVLDMTVAVSITLNLIAHAILKSH